MPSLKGPHQSSRTAQIRARANSDTAAAEVMLTEFLASTFDIPVSDVQINKDQYSLNSLNGFFASDGASYFFKFHQEEGEEDMQGEYYRADLLAKEALPVDMPVWSSSTPGEQVLVYRRRTDPRFADVLRGLDQTSDAAGIGKAIAAERHLNETILHVAKRTLHDVSVAEVAAEPIHHLFFERLIDPTTGDAPGGRYLSFYVDREFVFPGCTLSWQELSTARLRLNGQDMTATLGQIFDAALVNLNPKNLCGAGGLTAHGDAHNANVWYCDGDQGPSLTYFDPAFAGSHVPALIAEIKSTFHNVFAHPFWLYEPHFAEDRFSADADYTAGVLRINTDWDLSPVRIALLNEKIEAFWKPFLAHLLDKGMLPKTWQEIMRSALAMCPALVMDLRAGAGQHNPTSSAIGFFMVGLAGAPPRAGPNRFTDFFDKINPCRKERSDA